jgi:hypothetical protein
MAKAEIAKRLVEETPALLGEHDELFKMIEAIYFRDRRGSEEGSEEVPF